MAIIVGVKFRNTNKIYYFDPAGIEFSEGDGVIVETARGWNTARFPSPTATSRKRRLFLP